MRISRVYPGTAAEIAGLRIGDILRRTNGYLVEQRGNLAWIIAYATPDSTVRLVVTKASDGRDHALMASLRGALPMAEVRGRQDARVCFCRSDNGYPGDRSVFHSTQGHHLALANGSSQFAVIYDRSIRSFSPRSNRVIHEVQIGRELR